MRGEIQKEVAVHIFDDGAATAGADQGKMRVYDGRHSASSRSSRFEPLAQESR